MYRVIIKGKSGVTNCTSPNLLDGISCQEDFSSYFDKGFLDNIVSGGYMYFKYEDDELYTYTVYESRYQLTSKDKKQLCDYTQRQWSDGIGESFEQEPCMEIEGDNIFLSPWCLSQEITCEVEKI